MMRAGALLLLCICLVACVAPRSHDEPKAEHTRADCSGCHEREYRAAPHHVDAKPTRCAVCHSETSWQPAQLNHTWALTGAHTKADCASCHKGWAQQFEHTDRTCTGCHREAFEKAAVLEHAHALASSNCQDCHTTQAWRPAKEPRAKPPHPANPLQLSAAVTVASQPLQVSAVAAAPSASPATPPASASAAALRAQATAAPGALALAPAAPAQPAEAIPAAAAPALGHSTKSPASKRARRGDIKKRRALPAAPNDARELAEAPASASQSQAAQLESTPAASTLTRNGVPHATGAKPAATAPQPAAATIPGRSSRSVPPSSPQKPSGDAALRPQPLAAAGRTRSNPAASQAATPNIEGPKTRSREAPAANATAGARAKSPAAAGPTDRAK